MTKAPLKVKSVSSQILSQRKALSVYLCIASILWINYVFISSLYVVSRQNSLLDFKGLARQKIEPIGTLQSYYYSEEVVFRELLIFEET
jgi:hypothetical protein